MVSDYIERALARACLEQMEDGSFAASIRELPGVWADGPTEQECRAALREVLEEWLVAALCDDEELPELDGVTLNFAGKRWSEPSRASSLQPPTSSPFLSYTVPASQPSR